MHTAANSVAVQENFAAVGQCGWTTHTNIPTAVRRLRPRTAEFYISQRMAEAAEPELAGQPGGRRGSQPADTQIHLGHGRRRRWRACCTSSAATVTAREYYCLTERPPGATGDRQAGTNTPRDQALFGNFFYALIGVDEGVATLPKTAGTHVECFLLLERPVIWNLLMNKGNAFLYLSIAISSHSHSILATTMHVIRQE